MPSQEHEPTAVMVAAVVSTAIAVARGAAGYIVMIGDVVMIRSPAM